MTKTIALTNWDGVTGYAQVDDADYDALAAYRWHKLAKGDYAARNKKVGNRYHTHLMHRTILGLERGDPRQGDHINGDRLDNRRANLRIVTGAQNAQNVAAPKGYTSRYRGVGWDSRERRWRARVTPPGNGRRAVFLGYFATEEEAASVASAYRRKHLPYTVEEREHA